MSQISREQQKKHLTEFTVTSGLNRCLCCTQQRMQPVVMAAVLALVGQGCCGCHLKSVSIYVDVCGNEKCVQTTICEGHCFQEDPSYNSNEESSVQDVCDGDWVYEMQYIDGCPVSVPVAKNCKCAQCKPNYTYCGRLSADISNCNPYEK